MAKTDTRQAQLAAVHIAQKALGLTADDALALKLAVTGVASAGDMTSLQRRKYLAHLSTLQARQAVAEGSKPAYQPQRAPLQHSIDDARDDRWHKARMLWTLLAQAGHVHTNTDAALMAYVRRQTNLEHWRFLNTVQITRVIEALKRWCLRVGVQIRG